MKPLSHPRWIALVLWAVIMSAVGVWLILWRGHSPLASVAIPAYAAGFLAIQTRRPALDRTRLIQGGYYAYVAGLPLLILGLFVGQSDALWLGLFGLLAAFTLGLLAPTAGGDGKARGSSAPEAG